MLERIKISCKALDYDQCTYNAMNNNIISNLKRKAMDIAGCQQYINHDDTKNTCKTRRKRLTLYKWVSISIY